MPPIRAGEVKTLSGHWQFGRPRDKYFSSTGVLIALVGAGLGAIKGTWPSGRLPVGSFEEAGRQVKRVTNWLRVGLGLVALGTALQILGASLTP